MTAIAGFNATVKASGVAVVMTAEACALVSGNIYQITNTAKRIIDPATTLVVKENGVASVLAYTVNYLFGIITFPSAPTTPITVDGAYLPVAAVAECNGFDISLTGTILDKTSFDSSGVRTKMIGLLDGSVKLDRVSLFDDVDPVTALIQSIETRFASGSAYLLEIGLGGSNKFRVWLTSAGLDITSSVDSLVTESIDFTTTPQRAGASWAFGT